MGGKEFKELYERVRVIFWFVWGCSVIGALLENKEIVLLATFMILVMSLALIFAKFIDKKSDEIN